LKAQGYEVFQVDLGIELINKIFSREGFLELFDSISPAGRKLSRNSRQISQE